MSLHAFTPASPCPWLQTIGLTRSPDVFPTTRKIRAPSSICLAWHRSNFFEFSSCPAPFFTSCGLLLLPQPALDLQPREQEGRRTSV